MANKTHCTENNIYMQRIIFYSIMVYNNVHYYTSSVGRQYLELLSIYSLQNIKKEILTVNTHAMISYYYYH